MARIAGVDIPREKRLVISLTYVFGIGRTTASQICAATGIDASTRTRDLTAAEINKIRAYIAANDIENATATDVCNAVFADDPDTKPMMVGTILNKMVEAGMLDVETVKGKKTYTKA